MHVNKYKILSFHLPCDNCCIGGTMGVIVDAQYDYECWFTRLLERDVHIKIQQSQRPCNNLEIMMVN